MTDHNKTPRFEDRLAQLEALTGQMEEGKLGLEELLKLYEEGTRLSRSLQEELDRAQAALLDLKNGALKAVEDI